MIINTVKNRVPLPFAVIKTTASILLAVLLLAGIYGDVVSKIQPSQNQVTGRPRYETVLALFERSVNLLNGPPEYVRNRMAGAGENAANRNGHGDQAQRPPQQNAVSPGTIAVSVSNYLAFIILCSIVVYLIDKGAKRRGVTPRGGNRTMAQGIAG
jgi:hypothetical protein